MSRQRIAIAGGAIAMVIVFAFSGRYDVFRDELYFWACARHLAWGYVDHPPLSIALMRLLGDHSWTWRLSAALAFGVAVMLLARQAAIMGASAWGVAVSVIASTFSPLLLAVAGYYSMNVLEI